MNEDAPAARVNVTVRLRPASVEQIDKIAKAEKVERSVMIRTLIGEAVARRLR